MARRLTVLKFGGSVLGTEKDLPRAISEVYRWVRANDKVVVVASAYYGTTDRLEARAKQWGVDLNPHAAAELIATGELTSCSELTMALSRSGLAAAYLSPRAANMLSVGPVLDSDPISLKVDLIERLLEDNDVVVIPGFVACDAIGATNLLGRGGSDLSALFVAYRLRARQCRLLKDTDGLYEWDPKKPGPRPRCFASVTWEQALALEKRVLQPKALAFAKEQNMAFDFACIGNEVFTRVGAESTAFRDLAQEPKVQRLTLLGAGTVGRGVYDRLAALPDRYQPVAVAVRNPDKHRDLGDVPVFGNWQDALAVESDVVVELMGGLESAAEAIRTALNTRRHVVTGNKDVIAEYGPELEALAQENGVTLAYSAAVGGAVPMIERVRHLRPQGIARLRGVANGTCNFITDRVLDGESYDSAVQTAIEIGFAEADPSADLSGRDAANKIAILAREAFGKPCRLRDVDTSGIDGVDWNEALEQQRNGKRLRLVVSAELVQGELRAQVKPEYVAETDPLAQARGGGNALVVTLQDGTSEVVRGLGAGRYPTSEAVMADLLDLSRLTQRLPAEEPVPA